MGYTRRTAYLTDGWISRSIHVRWPVILVLLSFCVLFYTRVTSHISTVFCIYGGLGLSVGCQ